MPSDVSVIRSEPTGKAQQREIKVKGARLTSRYKGRRLGDAEGEASDVVVLAGVAGEGVDVGHHAIEDFSGAA